MVSFNLLIISAGMGLICFVALPWMIAPMLGEKWQVKVGRFYFWQSMMSYWNGQLVRRLMTGYDLASASHDPEMMADKVKINGEYQHRRDEVDMMSRLHNKPFGISFERLPVIVDVAFVELCQWHDKHTSNDRHLESETIRTDGGVHNRVRGVNPYFEVSKGLRLVDPSNAIDLISGSAKPDDGETAKEFTKKSQEGFRSQIGAAETLGVILGFGAGMGGMLLADKIVGSSGGGGGTLPPIPAGAIVNVPMMFDVTAVFL